jgi:hypothetical protein
MVRTLTRVGDSWALLLDQPILDRLNILGNTPLEVVEADGALVITRQGELSNGAAAAADVEDGGAPYPLSDEKFNAAVKSVMTQTRGRSEIWPNERPTYFSSDPAST